MRRSWTTAVTAVCAILAMGATGAAARSSPVGRTFSATAVTGAARSTLRLTLDAAPAGAPQTLSPALRARIADLLGAPAAATSAPAPGDTRTSAAKRRRMAAAKGPAVLRCDRNPGWSDARGTLHARFNCHHGVINWGYLIARKVQAVIVGRVAEAGVSWWRDGRRQPKNAGHLVGAGYLFHGTLKPVVHGDHVQFQDHMTFRVEIGGRTGTGSLTWAADVKAKK